MATAPHNKAPRVTIYDVAKAAGVTHVTVSRAFSGSGPVAEETMRRINRAASDLGYRPNRRAQSFAAKRSRCIGLLYGQHAPFFAGLYHTLVTEIAADLGRDDHDLLLIPALGGAETWQPKLLDRRVDGCIVMQPAPIDLEPVVRDLQIPMVIVNIETDLPVCHILSDEREAGRIAANHLIKLGHHNFWFIRPDLRFCDHYSYRERIEGVREARAAVGLDPDLPIAATENDEQVPRLQRAFANTDPEAGPGERQPTAVICYDDHMAYGLIRDCYRRHIRIPNVLSVVSFNDDEFSGRTCPPLTTVRVPAAEMGRAAVDRLFQMMGIRDQPQPDKMPEAIDHHPQHPNSFSNTLCKPKLVIRESTGLPA